jgi:hypothetical protein
VSRGPPRACSRHHGFGAHASPRGRPVQRRFRRNHRGEVERAPALLRTRRGPRNPLPGGRGQDSSSEASHSLTDTIALRFILRRLPQRKETRLPKGQRDRLLMTWTEKLTEKSIEPLVVLPARKIMILVSYLERDGTSTGSPFQINTAIPMSGISHRSISRRRGRSE